MVQIWRRPRKGRAVSHMWAAALVLSCPVDDAAAANARRRRRAPPTNSINQVAWTHDDRKVTVRMSCECIACLHRSACN